MNKSGTSLIFTPSDGGALQRLGEKFSTKLFTGNGNFSIPIALPPGRNGFEPEISLQYSNGFGNSSFGMGWGISVLNICCKTSKGIIVHYSGNIVTIKGISSLLRIIVIKLSIPKALILQK